MAGTAFYSFPGSPENDLVAVVPAQWLWREGEGFDKVEESLAETLAAELANSGAARVVAWPAITRYRSERKETRELAAELGAGKILMVSVRGESEATRVTVWLMDPGSNEKLRVSEYLRNDLTLLEAQRELAREITEEFAAQGGGNTHP
jgi:TolB-like protein